LKIKKEIEDLHINELKSLDDKFQLEVEAIMEEYRKNVEEIKAVSKTWETDLDQKQKLEIAEEINQINNQTQISFNSNKEYIMLKKKAEDLLVKSNKLKEAHNVKIKREKMEILRKEDSKNSKKPKNNANNSKNKYLIDKINTKHKNEKKCIKSKD